MKQIGPYRLEGVLGRGGMGTVYSGVHQQTGQRVAVKVLSAADADDGQLRKRFESEIEALIQLKHPNIVEIYAFGDDGEQLYFAMELVEGRSLFDELRSGRRFHWREVVDMGIDMCAGLRHAHDRGIIHRDVKPGNLLLTADGCMKLTDFGIAKMFGGRQITAPGGVVGTADYMSPEQALGTPITPRSDLFSLGSVFYALLTRRPPFAAKSLPQTIQNLTNEEAPLVSRYAPEVPDELEALIARLLSKEPEQRIGTAQALAKRLVNIQREAKQQAAGSPHRATDDEFEIDDPDKTHVGSSIGNVQTTDRFVPSDQGIPSSQRKTRLLQTGETTDADDNRDEDAQSDAENPAGGPHFMTAEQARRERATGMEDSHAHEPNIWRKIMMPAIALIIMLIVLVVGFRLAPKDSPSDDNDKQKTPTVLRSIRERLAGHLSKPPGTPIEQDLQEAVKMMAIEPEQAKVKLDAIITVYGRNRTKETAECLRVAQMLLEEIDRGIQQRLAVINKAIKWCSEQLTNQPKDVSKVSHALIDLYKDKTWAKSQVEQAQQLRDQADKLLEQPETKSSGSEK